MSTKQPKRDIQEILNRQRLQDVIANDEAARLEGASQEKIVRDPLTKRIIDGIRDQFRNLIG